MSAPKLPEKPINALTESPTYKGYAAKWGAKQANAVFMAAETHTNGVHDKMGSDPFRWALTIAIGYECLKIYDYRKHHGITPPWNEIKDWIREFGNLANHDGDADYIALFTGVYNEFIPEKTAAAEDAGAP